MKILAGSVLAAGALAAAMTFGSTAATAQTIGFATIPVGSINNVQTQVMAKVIENNSDLKMRVTPLGGTTATVVAVATQAAEFTIDDVNNLAIAVQGKHSFKRPLPNLRLALNLLAFPLGIIVRNDSDIKTLEDLEGRKFPVGWNAFPNGIPLSSAILATVELTFDDLDGVPTSGLITAANDFKAGKTDATFVAAGAPVVAEVNAAINGGVRFLSLPNTPEALARMKKIRPEYDFITLTPSPRFAGILGPTNLLRMDLIITTATEVPDETVYKFVKAIFENKEELVKGHPSFNGFFPDERMAKQFSSVEYHPGAIKFFKEVGIWPGN